MTCNGGTRSRVSRTRVRCGVPGVGAWLFTANAGGRRGWLVGTALAGLPLDAAAVGSEPLSSWLHWAGILMVLTLVLQASLLLASVVSRLLFQRRCQRLELRHWEQILASSAPPARPEEAGEAAWNGIRKFEVVRRVQEAEDICSFYLQPHDKKDLPAYLPGQHLTFQLHIPGHGRPVVRCYSLSDSPGRPYYRVTVKRLGPPPGHPEAPSGLGSSHFHDHVQEGTYLDVKAPSGQFHLDVESETPVVLLGAGVGITPLLSMLNAVAESGSRREIWLFYGVRYGAQHAMREHFQSLALEHDNFHLKVVYSAPRAEDRVGRDYDYEGHIDVDLLRRVLPSNNYGYYLCGPPPMIQALCDQLQSWGVPEADVHFEAFGPASVRRPPEADAAAPEAAAQAFEVSFTRSGRAVTWHPDRGSLLELAEASGVSLDFGCRAGSCGTCLTAVRSGKVRYLQQPGTQLEAGSCLACISVPAENLALDA